MSHIDFTIDIPNIGVKYLPNPQKLTVAHQIISATGEAIDGNYGTSFRLAYNYIEIEFLEPINSSKDLILLMDNLKDLSSVSQPIGYRFPILSSFFVDNSGNQKEIFTYHVIPVSFSYRRRQNKSVDGIDDDNPLIRKMSIGFVGTEDLPSLNTFVIFSRENRAPLPQTSGIWRV